MDIELPIALLKKNKAILLFEADEKSGVLPEQTVKVAIDDTDLKTEHLIQRHNVIEMFVSDFPPAVFTKPRSKFASHCRTPQYRATIARYLIRGSWH